MAARLRVARFNDAPVPALVKDEAPTQAEDRQEAVSRRCCGASLLCLANSGGLCLPQPTGDRLGSFCVQPTLASGNK